MQVDTILKELEQLGNPANVAGMGRFGIRASKVYGVTIPDLNRAAIRSAEVIRKIDSKAARWIAADALRELTSPATQKRLKGNRAR